MRSPRTLAASGGVLMLASVALTGALTTGAANAGSGEVETDARINPLNNSGAFGHAEVEVMDRRLDIEIDVRGLAPDLPHAQHIHFGAEARHECPTVADDTNGDFRLTTTEGAPAYGPIRVSLTTRGDTSPASALAVDRFPTAPKGVEHYDRKTHTQMDVANAIRQGKAVVVIHGVDYNANGEYDFASAGKSELDPSLPAEATDPAACGVLKR
jgi:hypothetical protein